MKRRLGWPGLVLAVGLSSAVLAGGITYAAIPDANGTVHGCLKSKGGVYVIAPSAGQTCGNDAALDWNKTGTTGLQGTAGPKGFTGLQGSAGSSGYEQKRDQESTDGSGNGSAEADCS